MLALTAETSVATGKRQTYGDCELANLGQKLMAVTT